MIIINSIFTIIILCLFFSVFFWITIGIPVGISYFIFDWLKKKGYKKSGITLMIVVFIFSSWNAYTAFYPRDRFYKKEFENNINLPFPKSGEILARGASYPDMHGDYAANTIMQISEADFEKIYNAIKSNPDFEIYSEELIFTQKFDKKPIQDIDNKKFTEVYILNKTDNGLSLTIGFNKTDKLIYFEIFQY